MCRSLPEQAIYEPNYTQAPVEWARAAAKSVANLLPQAKTRRRFAQESQLLGRGLAAQDGVAVREAPEAGDHAPVPVSCVPGAAAAWFTGARRLSPSMSTFGISRSSQRGSHQQAAIALRERSAAGCGDETTEGREQHRARTDAVDAWAKGLVGKNEITAEEYQEIRVIGSTAAGVSVLEKIIAKVNGAVPGRSRSKSASRPR